ncbi:DmsE family decaheme c-type cytochrome [Shewanella salipaludis]|uniref:DmsE family decaheme c-type cytochrome n=1 Tax=Shewanella salipaludis TaxID=2723052 RepID=A0A972G3Q9_9GAMM|nr:DmsE family decaheme c-type cytochrome [Shewanella salipaludis]NMH66659.1 DmsE family decaheme c-type cytochrome [Shewanella salipaludis]
MADAAEPQASPVSTLELKQAADYSKDGADTCLGCHDEDSAFPVLSIFKTKHGSRTDPHSPLAQYQCESCHGPVGEHGKKRLRKGENREAMITFTRGNEIPVAEKNAICSSCHEQLDKRHWAGSSHQTGEVACSDCHKIHVKEDPIRLKQLQVQVCGSCHQAEKLASKRFSTHPLEYGQMGCTDCHSPHGSNADKLLVADTINDTCFGCHAEKRGPFAWEHEPASENCALCHNPHGSNQPAMLTQKVPFLCQNCHSSAGHPSLAQDSSRLSTPYASSSALLLGRSCTNCHSSIHGSNHPSGSRFQR